MGFSLVLAKNPLSKTEGHTLLYHYSEVINVYARTRDLQKCLNQRYNEALDESLQPIQKNNQEDFYYGVSQNI